MAERILNTFDGDLLKSKEINKIDEINEKLENKLKELSDAPTLGDLQYRKKWDLLEKQVEISEEKEQLMDKDFSQEAQMKEMMGCSRNHSKEIDIYNKSYEEKIQRVISLKDEGNASYKEQQYDKASYYYAQALLIFYYLIPESKA
jgi:hypothetical protein